MRRPLSITIAGGLFGLTGCIGLVVATIRLADPGTRASHPGADHLADFAMAAGSALLAGAGGVFALRGAAWARWALAVWMLGHVVLSLVHSMEQLALHLAIFVPLAYVLFRPAATRYFTDKGRDQNSARP